MREQEEPDSFTLRVAKSRWASMVVAVLGLTPISCNIVNPSPAEIRYVGEQNEITWGEAEKESNNPTEKQKRYEDIKVQALADYLEPIIGTDFQILVAPEPLIVRSFALSRKDNNDLSGEPLGHNVYDRPVRNPVYKVGAIDSGVEYDGAIQLFITIPGKSGRNSIWAVSSEASPITSRAEYRFIIDLDGDEDGDRFSLSYSVANYVNGGSGEYFEGSSFFTPEQIRPR